MGAWRWYQETGNGYTADWGAHMFDIAQAANGWIEVARGYLACSDPSKVPAEVAGQRPLSREEQERLSEEWKKKEAGEAKKKKKKKKDGNKGGMAGNYETSAPHMQNFIDCVRSRQNPVAPVEVGCSTNTVCCLPDLTTASISFCVICQLRGV